MDNLDAFATPGINPPPAFSRLRRELHDAYGADRLAASRTRDTIEQLRSRAEFFRVAVEMYVGQPMGYWYAEMATRQAQLADEIEAEAKANGVLS